MKHFSNKGEERQGHCGGLTSLSWNASFWKYVRELRCGIHPFWVEAECKGMEGQGCLQMTWNYWVLLYVIPHIKVQARVGTDRSGHEHRKGTKWHNKALFSKNSTTVSKRKERERGSIPTSQMRNDWQLKTIICPRIQINRCIHLATWKWAL